MAYGKECETAYLSSTSVEKLERRVKVLEEKILYLEGIFSQVGNAIQGNEWILNQIKKARTEGI